MRAGILVAGGMVLGLGVGCPDVPDPDTLVVTGALERDGVAETSLEKVPVDFASKGARGEWWSCDLRLTAGGCIGDHHANAWLALPNITDFDGLGGVACADGEGNAFGAFELLTEKTSVGDPILVGTDVTVLVLVASDIDGDRSANLEDDAETTAASRLVDGRVTVQSLGSFDDPVAITIEGTTVDGNAVRLEMSGPTVPQPNPPPFDQARTCVDGDVIGR